MYRKMLFYIWVYCTYIRCNFPCLIYFSIGVEYTLRFVVCLQKSSLEVLHCVRPAETASTDLEELSAEQVKARFQGERAFLFKKNRKKKKNIKWLFIDALLLSRFILFIRFFFLSSLLQKQIPADCDHGSESIYYESFVWGIAMIMSNQLGPFYDEIVVNAVFSTLWSKKNTKVSFIIVFVLSYLNEQKSSTGLKSNQTLPRTERVLFLLSNWSSTALSLLCLKFWKFGVGSLLRDYFRMRGSDFKKCCFSESVAFIFYHFML